MTAPTHRVKTFIIVRALMAASTLAAVVAQYAVSFAYWTKHDDDVGFRTTNFLSFFTIDSNLVALVTLAIGAVLLARGAERDPGWFALLRGSAITYMVVTGLVYNTLLRNVVLSQGETLGWSNEVLHLILPIYMVVDWLFAPGALRVAWRTVGYIAIFPVVWVAYTMLRGAAVLDPFTGAAWYPYPFLDPANGGSGTMVVYIVIIAVTIVAVAVAVGAGVVAVWRAKGGVPQRSRTALGPPQ